MNYKIIRCYGNFDQDLSPNKRKNLKSILNKYQGVTQVSTTDLIVNDEIEIENLVSTLLQNPDGDLFLVEAA